MKAFNKLNPKPLSAAELAFDQSRVVSQEKVREDFLPGVSRFCSTDLWALQPGNYYHEHLRITAIAEVIAAKFMPLIARHSHVNWGEGSKCSFDDTHAPPECLEIGDRKKPTRYLYPDGHNHHWPVGCYAVLEWWEITSILPDRDAFAAPSIAKGWVDVSLPITSPWRSEESFILLMAPRFMLRDKWGGCDLVQPIIPSPSAQRDKIGSRVRLADGRLIYTGYRGPLWNTERKEPV